MFIGNGTLFGELENSSLTEAKKIKNKVKRKFIFSKRQQNFIDIFKKIEQGESLHVVSNGNFGNSEILGHLINVYKPEKLYCTTWSINDDFINLIEAQNFEINILIDHSIKGRKAPKLAMLRENAKRNGNVKIKLLRGIHAKIAILKAGDNFITIEASANYSLNVRIEQFVITNDKNLYKFNEEWIKSLL